MTKVVTIEEYEPHKTSEVICVHCGHRWYCVRPATTLLKHIVCPNGCEGGVIETGQELPDKEDLKQ